MPAFRWSMVCLGVSLLGIFAWFHWREPLAPSSGKKALVVSSRRTAASQNGNRHRTVRKIDMGDLRGQKLSEEEVRKIDEQTAKVLEEEKVLSDAEQEILEELRKFLAQGARPEEVVSFLRGLRAKLGVASYNDLPKILRRSIAALLVRSNCGAIGPAAMPEVSEALQDLVADSDPEVQQMSIEAYRKSLLNFRLSDYERADILVDFASNVDDADALRTLLPMVNMSRRSVGADALMRMAGSGTPATQEMIPDLIKNFTFREASGVSDLEPWAQAHPDGEFDNFLYGGFK